MAAHRFSFFLLLFLAHSLRAQLANIDSIQTRFEAYSLSNLTEKIYLHIDRNFYVTGETLWFSVYSIDGSGHKPLDLSAVAYVELLNRNGIAVLQGKVPLTKGRGNGSFFLPASLVSDNYEIRAYTNWMKNSGAGFFFCKSISIVNPFTKPEKYAQKETSPTIAFFPEGGNLVQGIKSKIAFSINDSNGKGIAARGVLVNATGDSVFTFRSNELGLGAFMYTPDITNVPQVIIENNRKQIKIRAFPEVHETGFTLAVRDSAGRIAIEVSQNYPDEKNVLLFIHARQIEKHVESGKVGNKKRIFLVDKSRLSKGINHITLFDDNFQPVAERLYFVYPDKKLTIGIETDQKKYGTRSKLNVALTSDRDASCSISVFKLDSLTSIDSADIYTHLWLESDLQGNVESPSGYFTSDAKKNDAIDLLMLTHGWRRFKWNDIIEGRKNTTIAEFKAHVIEARVTHNGKPAAGILTWLASPNKIIRSYPAFSDAAGIVRFETSDFYGARKLVIQSVSDSTFQFAVRNPFAQQKGGLKLQTMLLSPSMEPALLERSVAMQVQDIYHEKNRANFIKPVIDSLAFYGRADETFFLDDYTRFPVMEEVMREYVPGVLVRKRSDGFHFLVVDDVNATVMKQMPLILLDGVPIFNEDEIMLFDPRNIEKLEVLRRPYYLGPVTLSGIVSYTTYSGDLASFPVNPKAVTLDYEGLQFQREFYSPRYNTTSEVSNRMPDRRNLLYWSGEKMVGKGKTTDIEIFTSDLRGKFLIRVEGLSVDGHSGSAMQTVEVRQSGN